MALTSQIRYVKCLDSTATDGSGKTGLAFGDITAKYLTLGGTLTSLTTEDITTLGTYQAPTSSEHIRIKELAGSAPTKGVLEIHFHNTQLAAAGKKLWLFLSATGAVFQPLEVDLLANDVVSINQVATSSVTTINANVGTTQPVNFAGTGSTAYVKAGLWDVLGTALTETAGQIAAAFKQFFDVASPTGTMKAITNVVTTTNLTTNNDKTGYGLSSGAVQAIWDALTSALSTVGSIGKLLVDNINATISSRSTYAGADTSGTTTLLTRIASALTITGGKVDVNDKTGFSLSTAGVQAIWDALTSALTATGSIGKRLVDFVTSLVYSAPPATATISAAVWDEPLTGATHNIATSAGKRLRQVESGIVAFSGTISGTPSTTVIPLDATETTNDFYKPGLAVIESSFGTQFRRIDSYNGTTKEITLATPLATTPANGDFVTIIPWASVRVSDIDNDVITAGSIEASALTSIGTAVWSSASRTLTSFGTLVADIATAVWAAATRTLTAISDSSGVTTLLARLTSGRADNLDNLDVPVSSVGGGTPSEIADAVWDESIADHLDAGSTGAKLNSAAAAGDPWGTELPGNYTPGQAGAIIGRFNIAPPSSPLVVVPGPPTDLSLCRVYGYLETLDNKPAAGVMITFQLIKQPAKSERIIVGPKISVTADSQGRVANSAGNPWIDLQRNDLLTPAGSYYLMNCSAAGIKDAVVRLTGDLFDCASVIP